MHHHWIILFSAFVLEAAVGYPPWLYARIRHPVVWMGACITLLERNFNHPPFSEALRRLAGVLCMVLLLAVTWVVAFALQPLAIPAIAMLLASRSLFDHVYAVYKARDIATGREKLSRIVGRDVASLDQAGITRAAIESLAESFCDGVVAPLFWAACFGLPGIACYKAINTADSMIGHKDDRYRAFGWAAARLDDAANLIPARLSGLLIVLVSRSADAWHIMWRDARKHVSPNAGWPEAAMAGALDLQLGGPNRYDGIEHPAATLGSGSRHAGVSHLRRAMRLYLAACGWIGLILLLAAL